MKVKINKNAIVIALKTSSKSIDNKSPIVALSGVLLTAKDNKLTFGVTCLETSIVLTASCQVMEDGVIVVPHSSLLRIASSIKSSDITLSVSKKSVLKITGARSVFTLKPLVAPDDFPEISVYNGLKQELPSSDFLRLIRQISYCMSSDTCRPTICSMKLEAKDGKLRSYATDGHRLSIATMSTPISDFSYVLSRKTILEIMSILAKTDRCNFIVYDDKFYMSVVVQNKLDTLDLVLVAPVVEGGYPNLESAYTHNSQVGYEVEAKELLQVVSRLSPLTDGSDVPVLLSFKGLECTISAQNPKVGSGSDRISVFLSRNGNIEDLQDIDVAFQCSYLLDALGAAGSRPTLSIDSNLDPLTIVSDNDGVSTISVVMPVRK